MSIAQRPKDGVEDRVQLFTHVCRQEPQDQEAAFLQQLVLAAVAKDA